MQNYIIPYGVIEYGKGGKITRIKEKPEYIFTVNTGVYIMNKFCLTYIGENRHIDMNQLIGRMIKEGEKVITYPVNQNDYIDIGQWEEYKKAAAKMRILV